ncbi:hypothetical protein BX600DRAFT_148855 [Xylariales sp. PMI_506]|nr:hypothetical protein BX600DRAFT_148855 [Xylariales sp. PMI_506]
MYEKGTGETCARVLCGWELLCFMCFTASVAAFHGVGGSNYYYYRFPDREPAMLAMYIFLRSQRAGLIPSIFLFLLSSSNCTCNLLPLDNCLNNFKLFCPSTNRYPT